MFAIGAGMAGSVDQAFMNISGGISKLTGVPSDARLWLIVGIVLGSVTVATAVSGIQKAMKHIFDINVYSLAVCMIFLLVTSTIPSCSTCPLRPWSPLPVPSWSAS